MRKRVICDSSSLISLSMNCMLPLIIELSEKADFIITQSVYDEIITNPLKRGNHLMGPMNFKALIQNGILKVENADPEEARQILEDSNSIYYAHDRQLRIIQIGEAEALALANDGDILLMDERTLRFLIEKPDSLTGLLQHRMHKGITMNRARSDNFRKHCNGVSIIRSSEIVAVSYEMGILEKYFAGEGRDVLKACLWSLKYKGCSLSVDDIDEYLKMLVK
jgi:predicted nucleic acid-binding protein